MRTRILDCFNFFALCCVFVERKGTAGGTITQKDVTLQWINDFTVQLSSSKCQSYSIAHHGYAWANKKLPRNHSYVMEGNSVNLDLTECNRTKGHSVSIHLNYSELVKNVECYRTSMRDAACSWIPNAQVPELRFFYVFATESQILDGSQIQHFSQLKECPSYNQIDGVRTECKLPFQDNEMFISFRGKRNGMSLNTFRKRVASHVKPPPLNWNVSKMEDNFRIHWDYPDIPGNWKIRINYTECDQQKFKDIKGGNSTLLDRVPQCPYRLAIQAKSGRGNTPWTEYKYFEADPSHTYTSAVVFLPLLLVSLASVGFFCFRRNKDKMFPKIPQPRDLLSGISDSHFKSTPDKSKEEVCKISLVIELQHNNMKPLKHPLL